MKRYPGLEKQAGEGAGTFEAERTACATAMEGQPSMMAMVISSTWLELGVQGMAVGKKLYFSHI